MKIVSQIVSLVFFLGTACSNQAPAQNQIVAPHDVDAHFKNMTDRQNFERKEGQLCAAKSKAREYKKEHFSNEQQLLAFEFPDGARGGVGKILGNRTLNSLDDWQCGELEFEQCAGVQLYEENGYSHMTFIVVPSSEQDRKIISCALEHLAGSFNIGLSSNDPTAFGTMNEQPFVHLHNRQANK